MQLWIDQDCCTGAGLCVDRCPDLFVVLDDGIGYVRDGAVVFTDPGQGSLLVPARHERDAIDAAEHCPGECIYLEADARSAPAVDASDIDDADIVDAEIVDASDIVDASEIVDAEIVDAEIDDGSI